MVFVLCLLLAATRWWSLPLWLGAASLPLAVTCAVLFLGVALGRVLGAIFKVFGFDDFKRERVDLLLRMLRERPDWAAADVVCVQECYGAIFGGGFPERLEAGARAQGFAHVARPASLPVFPATFGCNSGLLVLSKRPILRSRPVAFKWNVEGFNVNRGAMHVELEGGVHVFTCHVSPGASNAGIFSALVAGPFNFSRDQQICELKNFIEECAPSGAPVVLAGDVNLDVLFPQYGCPPEPTPYASQLIRALAAPPCGLACAALHKRSNGQYSDADIASLHHLRPSFGYSGEEDEGGPSEARLSTFGTGQLRRICDDGVFFRDMKLSSFQEVPLCIPKSQRPTPLVTHLSDHWALRAAFELPPASSTPAGAGTSAPAVRKRNTKE